MVNTATSNGFLRHVHEIDVTTTKGLRFKIDICKNDTGFDSEVIVFNSISTNNVKWVYSTKPASASATDNFSACIEFIKSYLSKTDPQDSIKDVHNPCNTPFISEAEQNNVLSNNEIVLSVRLN